MHSRKLPHTQGVRAFISFDLAGSAAVKSSSRASFPDGPSAAGKVLQPRWLPLFQRLFRDIPQRLFRQLEVQQLQGVAPFGTEIWRITGDEILFVTSRLQDEMQLALLARAVYTVLLDMDLQLGQDPLAGPAKELGLKSVLWAAGFPIRNTAFEVYPSSPPFLKLPPVIFSADEIEKIEREEHTVASSDTEGGYVMREFLGPEIDLGFRLSAHTFPSRLLVSVDVAERIAEVCMTLPEQLSPNFHHVGWSVLKGLYGNRPYPLIWLDYGTTPNSARTSFEETQSLFLERYLSGQAHLEPRQLLKLTEQYLKDTSDTRIKMYIKPVPTGPHDDIYRKALGGTE